MIRRKAFKLTLGGEKMTTIIKILIMSRKNEGLSKIREAGLSDYFRK